MLGSEREAGAWGRDEMRNIMGSVNDGLYSDNGISTGIITLSQTRSGIGTPYGSAKMYSFAINASLVVPTGPQNVPPHIWQPIILYLGRPK